MPSETGRNQGQSANQWINYPPYGVSTGPGSIVVGGGGGVPEPFFRDEMDARRCMYRRVPQAQYPDGYLGTITSRKGDKMFDALKNRLNQRNYQRGVHKGERIDPADYFDPPELDPERGLIAEFNADYDGRLFHVQKQAPVGVTPVPITTEAILPASGARLQQTLNPRRQAQLRHLAPTWRY